MTHQGSRLYYLSGWIYY